MIGGLKIIHHGSRAKNSFAKAQVGTELEYTRVGSGTFQVAESVCPHTCLFFRAKAQGRKEIAKEFKGSN